MVHVRVQAPAFEMCLVWTDGQSSSLLGNETDLSGLVGLVGV